jgi:hypothetical protein
MKDGPASRSAQGMRMTDHANRSSNDADEHASGTFRTAQARLDDTVVSTAAVWQRFFQLNHTVVSQLCHDLSSPLGALLANVVLAREGIEAGLQAWGAAPAHERVPTLGPLLKRTQEDLEDALRLTERVVDVGRQVKNFARTGTEPVDVLALFTGVACAARMSLSRHVTINWDSEHAVLGQDAPSCEPWVVCSNAPRLTFALLGVFHAIANSVPKVDDGWKIEMTATARGRDVSLGIGLTRGDCGRDTDSSRGVSSWPEAPELGDARDLVGDLGGRLEVSWDSEEALQVQLVLARDGADEAER